MRYIPYVQVVFGVLIAIGGILNILMTRRIDELRKQKAEAETQAELESPQSVPLFSIDGDEVTIGHDLYTPEGVIKAGTKKKLPFNQGGIRIGQ